MTLAGLKKNDLVLNAFLLAFSTGLVRGLPIIVGYIISNRYGGIEYQAFVSFILLANFLTSISSVGTVSQILSLDEGRNGEFFIITIVGVVALICVSSVLYVLDLSISLYNVFPSSLFIIYALVYAVGVSLIHMSVARFNNLLENKSASIVMLVYCATSVTAVVIWVLLASSVETLFVGLTLAAIISGFICYFYAAKKESKERSVAWAMAPIAIKNTLLLSFFGFSTVGLFLFMQQLLVSADSQGGVYFSLLVQVFSVVTFVPMIIGNIVIPRVKGKAGGHNIYIIYFMLSMIVLVPFCIFYKEIALLYKIDASKVSISNVVFFMIFSVVSSVNSYTVQLLVGLKKFHYLVVFSFVLCVLACSFIYFAGVSLEGVLFGMSLSYVISSLGLYMVALSKGYLK